ncbi:MAG: methylated-DNA--[protein]-cysteine S-methyltransferase [Minwuia sp.]|nr:methylated-DNA--[protein]-cysteine S-methyltransferase [Minwuia sp.]
MLTTILESPLGPIRLRIEDEAITELRWNTEQDPGAEPGKATDSAAEAPLSPDTVPVRSPATLSTPASLNTPATPTITPIDDAMAHPLVAETSRQLDAYFAGKLDSFDLPVRPAGTTFQRLVWHIMQRIPKGHVRTYGGVAEELGASARAVGTACGRNPIPIIIPCHRIVAANGKLGGFSASGGVEDKVWLLRHEGALL